ncbi:FIST signal transduction protein [Alteromonas sp. AMM-1]|uniref:FIST signal transduction protein n=1 Tax=Alteromonas sp. AMM-1 TaxID=3394233 RepID=UPI0039A57EC4
MQVTVTRIGVNETQRFADELRSSNFYDADLNIAFGDVDAISSLASIAKGKANWLASTSCLGAMSNLGTDMGESYVHVMTISETRGVIGVASCDMGKGNVSELAESTVVSAMQKANRLGQMPSLVWIIQAPGQEEAVLSGVQAVLGNAVPVFGGSSADNAIEGKWLQFDGTQLYSNGLIIAVMYTEEPISCYFSSGYTATSTEATVTAVDGRVLYTLDGKPAGDVYNQWLQRFGQPALKPGSILSDSTYFPLGRNRGTRSDPISLLSHPSRLNDDNSLELFATLKEGEVLTLMHGERHNLISRAAEVAEVAMRTHELNYETQPKALLLVFCGGCMLAVKDQLADIQRSILNKAQGLPFVVAFTFGEQGCFPDGKSRHGNLMISATVFG